MLPVHLNVYIDNVLQEWMLSLYSGRPDIQSAYINNVTSVDDKSYIIFFSWLCSP